MRNTNLVMVSLVFLLAVLALRAGGSQLLLTGLMDGVLMFRDVAWLLLAAFALSGLIQVITYPEKVSRLLGSGAGWRGMLLGAAAGGLIPGGPYVYYPIASSFYCSGADIGTLMAFVVAKGFWDLARLPMEVAILGGRITAIRFLLTFFFPLLAGLAAQRLYPGLGGKLSSPESGADQ